MITLTELYKNLLQNTKLAKRKYDAAVTKFNQDDGNFDLFDEVIECRKDYSYARSKLGKFILEHSDYVLVTDE